MKIIDLLNKIAKGELPEDVVFFIGKEKMCGIDELEYKKMNRDLLNLRVEVIEEEPRDIEVCGSLFTRSEYNKLFKEDNKIEKLNIKHFHNRQRQLARKINEIIDKINEGE